jgi:hypothetical protein
MPTTNWSERLPGGKLIEKGLADFQSARRTAEACLIHIARRRLARAGLIREGSIPTLRNPELELYRLLREDKGDAYSRYNALLRELVSFENALDHLTSGG